MSDNLQFGGPLVTNSCFHNLIILLAILAPFFCSSSQLDCRTKTAFVVAKIKSQYNEQIPNETIEFAKSAAMEMCLSNNVEPQKILEARATDQISGSKPEKKSFLGIKFGEPERKEGNKRLLNRR